MTIATKGTALIVKDGRLATGCGCCDNCPQDNKPRTDPKNEGTWLPSGSWPSVTWTFQANPGDESGEAWFFYGSASTSKTGGGATVAEQEDWGNQCNWYSSKTTAPSSRDNLTLVLNKRATRLPPHNAVVHFYTSVSTVSVGTQTIKTAYFWEGDLRPGSTLTASSAAHGTSYSSLFLGFASNSGTIVGGATFDSTDTTCRNRTSAIVNGGAAFKNAASNEGTVNSGASFNGGSNCYNRPSGIINGGCTFGEGAYNEGTVNGGATFNATFFIGNQSSATVNGGATFSGSSVNIGTVNDGATFNNSASNNFGGVVNGAATFNEASENYNVANNSATFNGSSLNISGAVVNGGATFNNSAKNAGIVNGGATFNNTSENTSGGRVNGGATFRDAACSRRVTGFCFRPCDRKFVAHPTELPTCSGTAPKGCDNNCSNSCGCG